MPDNLSKQQRSRAMSRVRSKNTTPEVRVRKELHKRGFRYRLHAASLPGKPDIVLPAYKIALFVHGCFWHMHRCSAGRALPKTRVDYWLPKLEGNRRRDRSAIRALHRLGWQTVVIWECQTESEERLDRRLLSTVLRHAERLRR